MSFLSLKFWVLLKTFVKNEHFLKTIWKTNGAPENGWLGQGCLRWLDRHHMIVLGLQDEGMQPIWQEGLVLVKAAWELKAVEPSLELGGGDRRFGDHNTSQTIRRGRVCVRVCEHLGRQLLRAVKGSLTWNMPRRKLTNMEIFWDSLYRFFCCMLALWGRFFPTYMEQHLV